MSLYTDRKRVPLPPQATTFLTSSSIVPEYAREAPPQSSAAPVAPRSLRDFSAHDGNVPLGPRSMTHVNEELLPRNAPVGGSEYDRDRGRNSLRQPNHYSATLPPISASMNVDDEEGRTDRYSRVIIFLNFQISRLFMNLNSRLEAEQLSILKLRHSLVLVQITFRLETRGLLTIQMRDLQLQR
jgi:hypothetical protein